MVEGKSWSRTAILNRPLVLNCLSTAMVCVFYYIFFVTLCACLCFWLLGWHPICKDWLSWKICFLGLCFYGVWLRIIMFNWVYSNCVISRICVVIYSPFGSIENITWVIVSMVFKLTTIIMHSYITMHDNSCFCFFQMALLLIWVADIRKHVKNLEFGKGHVYKAMHVTDFYFLSSTLALYRMY